MKPGIIPCFCFLLLLPSMLFAQHDSLREEIINYNDKRAKMISNGRRLMLDSFLEGDEYIRNLNSRISLPKICMEQKRSHL